jgi:hypothetical protein
MKAFTTSLIIFCSLLIAPESALCQAWTQSIAPTNIYWSSIASSADGNNLVAVASSENFIYTSTDSGTTWVQVTNPPIGSWMSVASSADGNKLAVAGLNSPICLSTNSGVNWSVSDSLKQGWSAIASSAEGSKLLAAAQGDSNGNPGLVFTSTNSGGTWAPTILPNASWRSVASSADGTKLMAACFKDTNGNQCPIFLSTNSAASWISNNMPVSYWDAVACSSDGTKLIAGDYYGMIYTSTNSGNSWISNRMANTIASVASSSDGNEFIAVEDGGLIHVSTNYGTAWTAPDTSYENWTAVASSADGTKMVATAWPGYDDGIFFSDSIPSPRLIVSSSFANLLISWIVPSTNLVLQQCSEISTGNWTTLTNLPMLNFSNLHEQLTLSPTNSSGFFRLISK